MLATIIIALLIFGAVGAVVYRRFFRKENGDGCKSCGDVGCPLYDQAQAIQQNNKKHA